MIKLDVAKTVLKLIEFFLNLDSNHIQAANYCLHYLYTTKLLDIEYLTTKKNELMIHIAEILLIDTNSQKKIIFEKTTNVFFVNGLDRKSAEGYIFKLFDDFID